MKKKKNKPGGGKQIRIVLADDHPVVREGLAALIQSQPDMKVVSEAANGVQVVQQYLLHRPDVVLLDLRMPEMSGIEATRAILERDPSAVIIMLSTYKGDEDVYQSFKAGAKAYLLKDCRREELVNSVRAAHRGQTDVSLLVSTQLAAGIMHDRLTQRENEILKLVVAGKSNKEIGAVLDVTEGTVKVHMSHMFRKLGANGRTEAIRIALERGLVHLPTL